MKPVLRKALLLTALVATLVAVYFAPEHEGAELALPVTRAPADSNPAGAAADVEVLQLAARNERDWDGTAKVQLMTEAENIADPVATSFAEEPTPSIEPPAAEVQPGSGISIHGRYADGEDWRVFVSFEGRNYVVRAGDWIGDVYAVEAIEGDALAVRRKGATRAERVPFDIGRSADLGMARQ